MKGFQTLFELFGINKEPEYREPGSLALDTPTIPRSNSGLDQSVIKILKLKMARFKPQETLCLKEYHPNKKNLIFDLDNTLIYSSQAPVLKQSHKITIQKKDRRVSYHVIQRPGLHRALNSLSRLYNIYIYTTSDYSYAKKIIEVTGISKFICNLYDRSQCQRLKNGNLIKTLWSLGFEKEKTIFVDDCEGQISFYPENGIAIKRFCGESMDRELLKLADFLEKISQYDDIRSVSSRMEEYKAQSMKEFELECALMREEDERRNSEFLCDTAL